MGALEQPQCHCNFLMLHIAGTEPPAWFCRFCDQPGGICPKSKRSACG